MKVYDLDGNEFDKEPVDVAECVKVLGWSTTPKLEEVPEEAPEEKKAKSK